MWLRVSRAQTIIVLTVISVILVAVWNITRMTGAQDQTMPSDLQSYIEYLDDLTQKNLDCSVSFRFLKPLLETDEDWWIVPYIDPDSELHRSFHGTGSDYVCFMEFAGTTPLILCTPFSNIVTVNLSCLPS